MPRLLDVSRALLDQTQELVRGVRVRADVCSLENTSGHLLLEHSRSVLAMLAHLVDDLPVAVEITTTRLQASQLVSLVQSQGVSVVCLADLPPSPPSTTHYLVKRLHATLPELRILVGRWGPSSLADESTQGLRDAGATLVASTLGETRTYLGGLVDIPRLPVPAASTTTAETVPMVRVT